MDIQQPTERNGRISGVYPAKQRLKLRQAAQGFK
jgi:hypothetical protein